MTTITVTAEHIARGVADSCDHCPVALAIREALPHGPGLWVDSAHVTVGKPGHWTEVDLPDTVTHFIEAFDGGDPVRPFTFDLDYPAVTA